MFLRAAIRCLRHSLPVPVISCGLLVGVVGPASAVSTAFIDDFSLVKNGSLIFRDQFDDGVPPPSAPNFVTGQAASYFVNGTLNEAGGKARLDTVGAEELPSIVTGQSLFFERARLLTNIDPLDLTLGLKSNHTFSARGIFDLTLPTTDLGFYGIRLVDGTPTNTANDLVALGVRRGLDGVNRVEFSRVGPGTFEAFGNLLLDPNHEQILFDLTKGDAASPAITASFAYIDGGVVGPLTTYGATVDIFRGENFTRTEFVAFEPTPEPATLLLVGTTAAGIGLAQWRRRRGRSTHT